MDKFVFEIFCRANGENRVITGSYHKPVLEAENALAFVRAKTGDLNAVVWVITKVDIIKEA